MFDPCEKERREYKQAQEEEQNARNLVETPIQPLGIETPPPTNLDPIRNLLDKEEKLELKKKELEDCEKKHK